MKKTTILAFIVALVCADATAQQPAQPLGLQRVSDLFVQGNLEIQAARFNLERTKADQLAARLRPNPAISITAENLAVSGPTPFSRLYEVAATYSEIIELGGKRTLRERVANETVSVAEAQFEDGMRRGLADAKRLYYDALLARYNLDVAIENRKTFDQLLQFNVVRFQEGAIPEMDLIKVRLERVKFESAVRQAELSLRQSTIRLLEKLGAPPSPMPVITGDLTFRMTNLNLDVLQQSALDERPDVRAATLEVGAAEERLALEHARAKPDIAPFAGYKRIGSDNTILFGLSVPLKIRDRNQAGIARAASELDAARVRLMLARNRAIAEVESAYAALQTARELVRTFQDGLLQEADESRTITLAAYEEGGTELLPVLDAERTRAEVRRQYFKTLFDYQASMVELELAVGREIQ